MAQSVDVGITAAGLLSIQPVNDGYVYSPYLDRGLGGTGPGLSAGLSLITARGVTGTFEFSTAWFSVAQEGRFVSGPQPGSETAKLHDPMVTALLGFTLGHARTTVLVSTGASWVLDTPTSNGQRVDIYTSDPHRLALTLGGDVLTRVGPRVRLVWTGRYSHLERSEAYRQRGVGNHIVRLGFGVRIGLGS